MNRGVLKPSVLGVGVPRAGSTWFFKLLKSHPDIWVPPHRREPPFTRDKHYSRGPRDAGREKYHNSGMLRRPVMYRVATRVGKMMRPVGLARVYERIRPGWVGDAVQETSESIEVNLCESL